MKDINLELFKRYKPENKISIVEGLTEKELLGIKESTIIRIIKETGEFEYKSKRDKHLRIKMERRKGNDWNSTFSGILYHKGYYMLIFTYNTKTQMQVFQKNGVSF